MVAIRLKVAARATARIAARVATRVATRVAARLACFILVIALVFGGINWAVIDTRVSIPAQMMRDLYNKGDIDLVFSGTSQVFNSCDPAVFSRELGLNSFNAAMPSQNLRDAYYLLKEVFRLYDPQYVVLGVNPAKLTDSEEPNDISSSYQFDYMRWSPNKIGYLAEAFTLDYYPAALVPFIRVRQELTAADVAASIEDRIRELQGLDSLNASTQLVYDKDGFVFNYRQIRGNVVDIPNLNGFSGPDSVNSTSLNDLDRVVALCAEHDARLILMQTPMLPGAIATVTDYDAYHDYLTRYAAERGIEFWDFNYADPAFLELKDDMFSDVIHLTYQSAEEFSGLLADLMAEYIAEGSIDREGRFWTYENYRQQYPYAAAAWIEQADASFVQAGAAGIGTLEYQFSVFEAHGAQNRVFLTDWQLSDCAVIPKLEPGEYIFSVQVRSEGSGTEHEKNGNVTITVL